MSPHAPHVLHRRDLVGLGQPTCEFFFEFSDNSSWMCKFVFLYPDPERKKPAFAGYGTHICSYLVVVLFFDALLSRALLTFTFIRYTA